MKNISMKLPSLVACALAMAMSFSCVEKGNGEENNKKFIYDGVEYLMDYCLRVNQEGNTEAAVGRALDESNPTVRVIGVENMEEASHYFLDVLLPPDAKVFGEGGNMTGILTDGNGKEKNKLFFTAVNDGQIIAKVTLEKNIGMEEFVKEIHFLSRAELHPDSSIGGDCKFQTGIIYRHSTDGRNYLCVCMPSRSEGTKGFLICDLNDYHEISAFMQSQAAGETVNMPRKYDFPLIYKALVTDAGDVAGASLWQKFVATTEQRDNNKKLNITVPNMKARVYWVNEQNHSNEITGIYCLSTGWHSEIDPAWYPWDDDTYEWALSAYMIYYNDEGVLTLERCCSKGSYRDAGDGVQDEWPSMDSFSKNESLTAEASTVKLQ